MNSLSRQRTALSVAVLCLFTVPALGQRPGSHTSSPGSSLAPHLSIGGGSLRGAPRSMPSMPSMPRGNPSPRTWVQVAPRPSVSFSDVSRRSWSRPVESGFTPARPRSNPSMVSGVHVPTEGGGRHFQADDREYVSAVAVLTDDQAGIHLNIFHLVSIAIVCAEGRFEASRFPPTGRLDCSIRWD